MNCAGLVLALATLSCNSSPPPPAPREQPPTVPVVVAEPRPPNPRPSKELRDALALDGPDAPTAVDPREETRLVAHSFTELQVYRVANGKLTLEARTPIEKFWTVRSWAWANANELVVLLGNGVGKPDYQLVWFRDGAFKPLAAPAEKSFMTTTAPPGHGDDRLFATQSGEVWWHNCRASQEREPHRCIKHVSVRVLPEASAPAHPPAERAPSTTLVPPPPCPRLDLKKAEWVSLRPPVARLGQGEAARFVVGCKPTEAWAEGIVRGPRGFWSLLDAQAENIESKRGLIVLWHTRSLGVLPEVEALGFSP